VTCTCWKWMDQLLDGVNKWMMCLLKTPSTIVLKTLTSSIKENNKQTTTTLQSMMSCFRNNSVSPMRSTSSINRSCVLYFELCALQNLQCYYRDDVFLDDRESGARYNCIFFSKTSTPNEPLHPFVNFTVLPRFKMFLNGMVNGDTVACDAKCIVQGGGMRKVFKIGRTNYIKTNLFEYPLWRNTV